MRLLVGSVYGDHPRSRAWYKLQCKYLGRTTRNYDHVVYANGGDNFYGESRVIAYNDRPGVNGQEEHLRGLQTIVGYFNEHEEYESLLVLDSDAFPVQPGWEVELRRKMGDFRVAAAARYENLDTFAHPCIFYTNRPASDLTFAEFPHVNMAGFKFSDPSSNVKEFFPLIRTNRVNHHPILCAIYWNAFYHHGAGSRNLAFRLFYNYLDDDKDVTVMEERLFEELVVDSDGFLARIMPERALRLARDKERMAVDVPAALQELARIVGRGEAVIVVDGDEWALEQLGRTYNGRRMIPFLEKDGQYWGPPTNDETAIRELERIRESGANFIAFASQAFWWLDYYASFYQYLQSRFRCVLQDDRFVVFDLRIPVASPGARTD